VPLYEVQCSTCLKLPDVVLCRPQMVIKVEQTEPEELMPNMLSAATRNLQ
jgi:hypothetical protein